MGVLVRLTRRLVRLVPWRWVGLIANGSWWRAGGLLRLLKILNLCLDFDQLVHQLRVVRKVIVVGHVAAANVASQVSRVVARVAGR